MMTARSDRGQLSSDADQVELEALRKGFSVIDSGTDDELVAGVLADRATDSMSPGDSAQSHQDDLIRDDSVGPIHEELARRSDILQQSYPFDLNQGTLVCAEDRRSPVYEFLLSASVSAFASGRHAELPRIFERVATRLVTSYFGSNAEGVHFGWPRDGNTSFKVAAEQLHGRTGEWLWGPEERLDPADVKDEGCDFVIWLHPSDGRKIGLLFVLGQCACGNNWQDKCADLNVKRMERWFNPLSTVDPVRAFATPRHVDDYLLREASREAGLLFDRARLVLVASSAGADVLDSGITGRMSDLTALVRDG